MKKKQNKVKYKGVIYDIDRSHRNVLSIFDWIENGGLDAVDQGIMIVTKLFGVEAPVEQPLIDLAFDILSLGKDVNEKAVVKKKDMDFLQDYDIYRADIIREYGVDIAKENIDFDVLWLMLENLSNDARFNQVREIRNKDLSKIKDAEERKQWREAQEYYKLEESNKSEEEKKKEEHDKKVLENYLNRFK